MRIQQKLVPLLILVSALFWTSRTEAKTPIVIRVGIVAYQNFESTYDRYQNMFSRLSKADSEYDITFSMAVGTYGEVMDWYGKKLIDVAVLTPGPVAELLTMPDAAEVADSYIATHVLIPAEDRSLAQPDRVAGSSRFKYHAVPIISPDSCTSDIETKLCDFSDLQRLAGQGRVRFLFVHPLSVSGFILPSYVLHNNGIDLSKNTIEWTYSQDKSVEQVSLPSEDDKIKVAFVWDGVEPDYCKVNIKKLVTPKDKNLLDIESYSIPQEIALLNTSLKNQKPTRETSSDKTRFEEYKRLLVKLLTDPRKNPSKDLSFAIDEKWQDAFQNVKLWLAQLNPTISQKALYGMNLKDLRKILQSYKKSHPLDPLRIALVLSGGGAKCAYQLGAIEVLEENLQEWRDQGEKDMDIGLVVGTSGGAINALCVALGVSKDEAGRLALRKTWRSFNQRSFFQPWPAVSFFYGLFWGMLQAALLVLLILIIRFLLNIKSIAWWRTPAIVISAIGFSELLLSRFIVWSPWEATGEFWRSAQFFQHFWLLVMLISFWAAPWLLMIGTTMLILGWSLKRRNHDSAQTRGGLIALVSILGLNALALIYLIYDFARSIAQWGTKQLRITLICFAIISGLLLITLLLLSYIKKVVDRRGPSNTLMTEIMAQRKWLNTLAAIVMVLLANMFVIAALTLRYEISLSSSEGIEGALAENMSRLMSNGPVGDTYESKPNRPYNEQLKDISKWIIEHGRLKRDLVITVSRLPSEVDQTKPSPYDKLPSDLYFYHSKQPCLLPLNNQYLSFDNRQNKELLMDVVIGSSSIYPVFPPRRLEDISTELDQSCAKQDELSRSKQVKNEPPLVERIKNELSLIELPKSSGPIAIGEHPYMDVIDGGYIHNSPIAATIPWKPTHIILIEASPQEKPREPQNFLDSSLTAFNYLFYQAQRLDAQAKGKVDVFELRPASTCTGKPREDPALCTKDQNLDTFDFSPNRVDVAIQRGRDDAQSSEAHFLRQSGPPQFTDVSSELLSKVKYHIYCAGRRITVSDLPLAEFKAASKSPAEVRLLGEYDKLSTAQEMARNCYGGINAACTLCR